MAGAKDGMSVVRQPRRLGTGVALGLAAAALLAPSAATGPRRAPAQERAPAPQPAPSKDQVIDGVRGHLAALRKLPNLVLKYTLTHERVAGAPRFAFDRVELVNAAKGDKLRTEARYTLTEGGKTVTNSRVAAWNGKVATAILDETNDIDVAHQPDTLLFYYRYYYDFLSYPEGTARAELLDSLAPLSPDYWLPDALERYRSEYHLRDGTHVSGGAPCVLLERPGADRLWIDPAHGFLARRRDTYYPGGAKLKERTTLDNLRQVDGVWLPAKLVRETFGGLDEDESLHNKLCGRSTILLTSVSTEPLGDDYFLLSITPGMNVHDKVRGLGYRALKPGEDPVREAMADALEISTAPRTSNVFLFSTALALGVGIVVLLRLVRKQARGESVPRPR